MFYCLFLIYFPPWYSFSIEVSLIVIHFTFTFRRRAESTVVLLENDIKRVKVELQTSRQCESELRTNMHSLMANERSAKIELQQLKSENISIQHK